MLTLGIGRTARMLACAGMLAGWAMADRPASRIAHNPSGGPWVLDLDPSSVGKVKIFSATPDYDEDDDLTNEAGKIAELTATGTTRLVLSKGTSNYWIIFYPKGTALHLTLSLSPQGTAPAQAAKLTVQEETFSDRNFNAATEASLASDPEAKAFVHQLYGVPTSILCYEVKVEEKALPITANYDFFEAAAASAADNLKAQPFLTLK